MTKVNGIPVDPLINVEVHMYFEVHNSDLWGGKGSVGYMEVGYCCLLYTSDAADD